MRSSKEVAEKYFNESLKKYFERKEYSIPGTYCYEDSQGIPYITYALVSSNSEFFSDGIEFSDLKSALRKAVDKTEVIINGLIEAKKSEKPEGLSIDLREVQIEWRSYPYAVINDEFLSSPGMKVSFRCSVHHK